MAAISLKQHLSELARNSQRRLVNDLNAIPVAKHRECNGGGCTRTPLYMVAECAAVNGFVAKILRGEEVVRPPKEEREAFLVTFDTAEKVLTFLEQQTQDLLATYDTLEEATLGDILESPMGPRSRFSLAELPSVHMSYHDGQLNYIQMLHDDPEIHWG